jgi:hypothetical protein
MPMARSRRRALAALDACVRKTVASVSLTCLRIPPVVMCYHFSLRYGIATGDPSHEQEDVLSCGRGFRRRFCRENRPPPR